ncbi:MAG TPA: heavy metal sensor histidine kinase [Thiobacillaceae bacterium]|nr:heavy metal sensor histidine kinase [Thiobacillaceae bacterium]
MKILSLTTRVSLLFAIAASVVLLATGLLLSRAMETYLAENDRQELEGHMQLIRHLLEGAHSRQDFDRLPQDLGNALVGHKELAVTVVNARGNMWFSTPSAAFPQALLRRQDCGGLPNSVKCLDGALRQWQQGGHDYRGMVVPTRAGNGEAQIVAAALDIQHHEKLMNRFRDVLGIGMGLAMLAMASLGWIATRRGLAPLRRVTDLVAGISAKHLASRLPVTGLPPELHALATTFNAMLTRLDESFRRLSEFSSDIAHELRTPISNLMTEAQVALSSARTNEEYRESLYSSLEEYERMAQMVGSMLYLAQADNGLLTPSLDEVDLAAETQGLFEYFEAWADERGVCLTREGSAIVSGDRLMLRRALSNLLSNAIRHTPSGQSVHVSVETSGGETRIAVLNPGAEIAAQHLPRLFDRFYRVDPSCRYKNDGAGLGLAIVQSIVKAHGGTVAVSSSNGMTKFLIALPILEH